MFRVVFCCLVCFVCITSTARAQGPGGGEVGVCMKLVQTTCAEEFSLFVGTCDDDIPCEFRNDTWSCVSPFAEEHPFWDPLFPAPEVIGLPFEVFEEDDLPYNLLAPAEPLEIGFTSFLETQRLDPCGGWQICQCNPGKTKCIHDNFYYELERPYNYEGKSGTECIGN